MEQSKEAFEGGTKFMRVNSADLQELRSKEKNKFKDLKPSCLSDFLFLRTVKDLKVMREEYEDGIRVLDRLKPWDGHDSRLIEQALSHLRTGHKQSLFIEKYVQLAVEKSLRTAVKFVQWLEAENLSFADDLEEAGKSFEEVSDQPDNLEQLELREWNGGHILHALDGSSKLNFELDGQYFQYDDLYFVKIKSEDDLEASSNESPIAVSSSCGRRKRSKDASKESNWDQSTNSSPPKDEFERSSKEDKANCGDVRDVDLTGFNGSRETYDNVPQHLIKCSVCEKIFKTRREYDEHEKSHVGDVPYQCKICFMVLASKSRLKAHYAIHVNMNCAVCGRSFRTIPQISKHMRDEHDIYPEDVVPAEVLPARPQPVMVKPDPAHEEPVEDGKKKKKPAKKKKQPSGDVKAVPSKERVRYDCQYCGKMFRQKWKFTEHLKTHTGEKPFKCDICSRRFASKGTYKDHVETHSAASYPCAYCGKRFSTKAQMSRHMREIDFDDAVKATQPEVCDICGRMFVSKKKLEFHMRFHQSNKQFACEVCGKAFHGNLSLNCHRRHIHKILSETNAAAEDNEMTDDQAAEKAEKHVCSECGKCFSTKTKFKYHYNIHTGEKPYKCKVCPKSFTSPIHLFSHKDVHTDEKFPCEYCGKMLNTRACLYRHRVKQHKHKKPVKPAKDENGGEGCNS